VGAERASTFRTIRRGKTMDKIHKWNSLFDKEYVLAMIDDEIENAQRYQVMTLTKLRDRLVKKDEPEPGFRY
jgi:hypothetical protein